MPAGGRHRLPAVFTPQSAPSSQTSCMYVSFTGTSDSLPVLRSARVHPLEEDHFRLPGTECVAWAAGRQHDLCPLPPPSVSSVRPKLTLWRAGSEWGFSLVHVLTTILPHAGQRRNTHTQLPWLSWGPYPCANHHSLIHNESQPAWVNKVNITCFCHWQRSRSRVWFILLRPGEGAKHHQLFWETVNSQFGLTIVFKLSDFFCAEEAIHRYSPRTDSKN